MDLEVFIREIVINYGLFSIFLIVALEYANIPIPSEVVLPFVGILALEFDFNIVSVIAVSILGGIIGSLTNYYLGYKFGNPLLYKLKEKYPKTKRAIKESNKWMEKYDKYSVMISRVIPVARTFISIIAGVTRMNIFYFILFSSIGIGIWNTLLINLGYFIGDNMDKITIILSRYTQILFVIIILFIIYLGYKFYNKNKDYKNNMDDINDLN